MDAHVRVGRALMADLQTGLRKAKDSGIGALQEFAMRLRSVHAWPIETGLRTSVSGRTMPLS